MDKHSCSVKKTTERDMCPCAKPNLDYIVGLRANENEKDAADTKIRKGPKNGKKH